MVTKAHKKSEEIEQEEVLTEEQEPDVEQDSDEIIDSLFTKPEPVIHQETGVNNEHIVDPDEFALYKKYLD